MTTYRTGNHWGTTIIREGACKPDEQGRRGDDALVAVVVGGDAELAERICGLLNADADRDREGPWWGREHDDGHGDDTVEGPIPYGT